MNNEVVHINSIKPGQNAFIRTNDALVMTRFCIRMCEINQINESRCDHERRIEDVSTMEDRYAGILFHVENSGICEMKNIRRSTIDDGHLQNNWDAVEVDVRGMFESKSKFGLTI